MNSLYFIRHGRTEANEKKLYCGSTDLPLSEQGIEELQTLAYTVPAETLFVTSGMKRTEQTLEILFGNVPHQTDAHFREVDFGLFEMKGYEELKDREDYQQWISGDNEKNIPPQGESGEQMVNRVLEGLQQLQTMDQPVVLIAHGGVIAAIMAYLFPEEGKNRYQWQPQPGHGYLIIEGKYQEITDEKSI